MTVIHHPSEAVLMAYGAGSLGEGQALVVAAHLSSCPICRDHVASLEAVGGSLLDTIAPEAMTVGALEAILARLDDLPADIPPPPPPPAPASLGIEVDLPAPLRAALTPDMSWQLTGPGMRQLVIHPERHSGGPSTRLLRIAPGVRVPGHGHPGLELTLVLDGGYTDPHGHFGPGDVAELEADTHHQPVTDRGRDCICLVSFDAPIEFQDTALGPLQRLFGR
ncbi:MAG: ChrR family anti-sigma-E factor [Rhodospirillaceae bacterium]